MRCGIPPVFLRHINKSVLGGNPIQTSPRLAIQLVTCRSYATPIGKKLIYEEIKEPLPPLGKPRWRKETPFSICKATSAKELERDDVGKILHLANARSLFPEGASYYPEELLNELGLKLPDAGILVRQVAFDLCKRLQNAAASGFAKTPEDSEYDDKGVPNFVLTGPRGVGKTMVLNHVVNFCRSSGWLVVYIPNLHYYCNEPCAYPPSRTWPGCYDQYDLAPTFLESLRAANADMLSTLPLRLPFQFPFKGSNLLQLLDLGLERHKILGCPVAAHIIRELKLVTEVPVLIALDDYNIIYKMSDYTYVDDKDRVQPIAPYNLTLIRHLCTFPDPDLKHGGVVVATSERYPVRETKALQELRSGPYAVPVPRYSWQEMKTLLRYYEHLQIARDREGGFDDDDVREIAGVSGRIGLDVFTAAVTEAATIAFASGYKMPATLMKKLHMRDVALTRH